MTKRGYQDYERPAAKSAEPELREDMKGWINFKRPIDLNTVVILFGVLVGGLSFRADTVAALGQLREQLGELKQQLAGAQSVTFQRLDKLGDRVDSLLERGGKP